MKLSLGFFILLVILLASCKKNNNKTLANVSTTAISNITSTSAQTGGDIIGNGGTTITQSGICWATHTNPTLGDSIVSTGSPSGSYTINLTNLHPNTGYYIRAYAVNSEGTAYGNVDSFMTSKGLPTVTTTAVSDIIPLSATSGGDVVNDGGATVTTRGLCFSTSPHPTISNFITSDSNGTGTFVDSLKPLASQTQYYVRAYASNSFGTAYGDEISFTSSSANTVLDYDGNVYAYVTIGTQIWMTSNLRVTHYQNGDTIENGYADNFGWWNDYAHSLYTGAYTFPNGDTTQKSKYGLIYNNYAVNDSRNMCPLGWHVPTDADWETLEYFEGMAAADTGSTTVSRNATNPIGGKLVTGGASGLNLQLGGQMNINSATSISFANFGTDFYYWTSTSANIGRIANYARFMGATMNVERTATFSQAGSVRCMKN